MGIYIKGMEMPKDCMECPLETDYGTCGYYSLYVEAGHESDCEKRRDDCPLIELPPHGRLIDADALRYLYEPWENEKELGIDIDKCVVNMAVVRANIDDAPTIIPAEEGE